MPALDQAYDLYEDEILLEHYFPEGLAAQNSKTAYLTFIDKEGLGKLAKLMHGTSEAGHDRLIAYLAISSPKGTKSETGGAMLHAVFLGVDFKERIITYQDPYGLGIDERTPEADAAQALLWPFLAEVYPEFEIREPKYPQQHDQCSCSPITIHNMVNYAKSGTIPEHVDVMAIRSEHNGILAEHKTQRLNNVFSVLEKQLRDTILGDGSISSDHPVVDSALKAIKGNMDRELLGNYEDAFTGQRLELGRNFIQSAVKFITGIPATDSLAIGLTDIAKATLVPKLTWVLGVPQS